MDTPQEDIGGREFGSYKTSPVASLAGSSVFLSCYQSDSTRLIALSTRICSTHVGYDPLSTMFIMTGAILEKELVITTRVWPNLYFDWSLV